MLGIPVEGNYVRKKDIFEVVSNFKTAKKSFLRWTRFPDTVNPNTMDEYIEEFKKSKDSGKIKSIELKNIDYWAKQGWPEFKDFVDTLKKSLTETQKKKTPWKDKVKGGIKTAENEDWVIYKVVEYAFLKKYGSRNICIVRKEDMFSDYHDGGPERENREEGPPSNFYLALSKTKSSNINELQHYNVDYADPLHNIVIEAVGDKTLWYWTADGKVTSSEQIKTLDLPNFPKFKADFPEYCNKCFYRKGACECCDKCHNPDWECTCDENEDD